MKKVTISFIIKDSQDEDALQRALHADDCYNVFHKLINQSFEEKIWINEKFKLEKKNGREFHEIFSEIVQWYMDNGGITLEHFR